jgi:hypothetical protein
VVEDRRRRRGRRGRRRRARVARAAPGARRSPRGRGAIRGGVGTRRPRRDSPFATSATLSGVRLGNANGERCGGRLTRAFVESCNSVFAPLGAKVGATRLVATARAFGFGEQPAIPAAKASTIAPVSKLSDDLAVGAAAIGQDRDLATPLQMASVGATIALGGRRTRPRIATIDPIARRRAVTARTPRQVRAMMLDVVRSGTGTAAAIPGVRSPARRAPPSCAPTRRIPGTPTHGSSRSRPPAGRGSPWRSCSSAAASAPRPRRRSPGRRSQRRSPATEPPIGAALP